MLMKQDLEAKILKKIQDSDLPAELANPTACRRLLGIVTDSISEALVEDGGVRITGFGKFSLTRHKERTGRNMRTQEPVTIPAHCSVNFKPGTLLKDAVKDL